MAVLVHLFTRCLRAWYARPALESAAGPIALLEHAAAVAALTVLSSRLAAKLPVTVLVGNVAVQQIVFASALGVMLASATVVMAAVMLAVMLVVAIVGTVVMLVAAIVGTVIVVNVSAVIVIAIAIVSSG